MDRLTSMQAFVRVVDAGSFTGAAAGWGRSKAVVSKYVQQLETHLGVRLLQRTTRSQSLTDAGRAHYERCVAILQSVEEAEASLREQDLSPRGSLRVSAPPGLFDVHGRALISPFIRRYPLVRLELDLTHRRVDLVEERIDVALRLTQPEDSSLIARRLAPAPLIVVASPAYLSREGQPTDPTELVDHATLVDTNHRHGSRWPFLVDGAARSVHVKPAATVNSPVLIRSLALDGLGIALLPRMLVDSELTDGRLVEILPDTLAVTWSVWAITSHRRHLPLRSRVFIDHARDYFSEEHCPRPTAQV